jgi:tRNA(fMet)-specific endonuclease VapC
MYLLDTDVFSAIARGRDARLVARARSLGLGQLAVSVVTEAEIRYGQACQPVSEPLAARIDALLDEIRRLPLAPGVVAPYASLRASLRRAATPIGPNDLWIAAHALAEDLTLVTGNEREFSRVPGLRVENWLR